MSSLTAPSSVISRVRHELRHRGLKATIGKVAQYARERVYVDHTQVWYELPLGIERPRASLPSGLALTRGGAGDLPLLDELPGVHEWLARQRIKAGDDLWLVLDGRRPVFACWTLHGSVPVAAATNGRLVLPPESVCLEDAVTSPSYRGRGLIAPAAFSQIADKLEKTRVKSIIADIGEGRKAAHLVAKRAGFRVVVTTRFQRVGLWKQTTIVEASSTSDWLVEQFRR